MLGPSRSRLRACQLRYSETRSFENVVGVAGQPHSVVFLIFAVWT